MSRRMIPLAAITAAVLLSAHHPAAAQPSDPPAPTPAWREGDPQAVIARVLGKPVTRGDLAAAADALRALHPAPSSPDFFAEEREQVYAKMAIFDAVLMPLVESEARARGITPTAEELANYRARQDRHREQLRKGLYPNPEQAALRSELYRERLRVLIADVEIMEEIKHGYRHSYDAEQRRFEASVLQQDADPEPAAETSKVDDHDQRWIVTFLKLQSSLFEQHGGSAAESPLLLALIAPDAVRTWLTERNEAGEFTFSEPADREVFLGLVNAFLRNSSGGPLLQGEEAKALLARTPGWAPLEPEPPAPKPEKPAEPVVPATPPQDPNEVLAEVLGVPITRSQIDPGQALAWAQNSKEMKPGGSRDCAAVTELLLMPLFEREAGRNGFMPTEAELVRFHAAVRARDIEMLDQRLPHDERAAADARADAERPDFDEQTRAGMMEYVRQVEAALESTKARKATIQAERIDTLDAEQQKAWRAFLLRSKAHRWLFDRYGGPVALGSFGTLYAFEALDQWLAEQERDGRLRFMNDQMREAFHAQIAAMTKRALPQGDLSYVIRGDDATRFARSNALWEQ